MNDKKIIAILTIIRYPAWAIPFAILSMAVFRLPLWLGKKYIFWKLMGSGKNGTFDKNPDWQQWALLTVRHFERAEGNEGIIAKCKMPSANLYSSFIASWWRVFCCSGTTFILEPIEGHGLWDGKEAFGPLPANTDYEGEIAVLTRATIRLSKLKNFWNNVDAVARQMAVSEGFIQSYGIGELPFIKQATFSIWESKAYMKQFAYKMKYHADVIRKTRREKWYIEEMFVRFRIWGKVEM